MLGFLGSRLAVSGTLMPNYGLFCASTAFFYMMLYELTSMLSHVIRSPRIVQVSPRASRGDACDPGVCGP